MILERERQSRAKRRFIYQNASRNKRRFAGKKTLKYAPRVSCSEDSHMQRDITIVRAVNEFSRLTGVSLMEKYEELVNYFMTVWSGINLHYFIATDNDKNLVISFSIRPRLRSTSSAKISLANPRCRYVMLFLSLRISILEKIGGFFLKKS